MPKGQILIVDFGTRHLNSLVLVVKSFIDTENIRVLRITRPDLPPLSFKFTDIETEEAPWEFNVDSIRGTDMGVFMSGSADHVGDPKGFRRLNKNVLEELPCPVMGLCSGHQLISFVWDDSCEMVPHSEHGNTMFLPNTEMNNDPVFQDMPRAGFLVAVRHNWSISKVPTGFVRYGETRGSHSIISAIKHYNRPIYGVQFHPELPVPGLWSGRELMGKFIELSISGALTPQ